MSNNERANRLLRAVVLRHTELETAERALQIAPDNRNHMAKVEVIRARENLKILAAECALFLTL